MSLARGGAIPAPLKCFKFVGGGVLSGYYLTADGKGIKGVAINHTSTADEYSVLSNIPNGATGMNIKSSTGAVTYVIADEEGNTPFNEAACLAFNDRIPTTPTAFGRVAG